MSVLKSKFIPHICCQHRWRPTTNGIEECRDCFAVCRRGADGQIEVYSAAVENPKETGRTYTREYPRDNWLSFLRELSGGLSE